MTPYPVGNMAMTRAILLVTTLLIPLAAHASDTISPGSGPITDASGNVWHITPEGSIQENGEWTPGGGGTAALTIFGGQVYGLDANGKGWLTLSGDGQYWTESAEPTRQQKSSAVNAVGAQQAVYPATPSQTSVASCGTGNSTGYNILPLENGGKGQIIGPDQRIFTPRGVDAWDSAFPSAAELLSYYPGINFIRLAVYHYQPPEELAPVVNDLTSHGIVVQIGNYDNNAGDAGGRQGSVFTGDLLARESAWYAAQAAYWKNNGNVWFSTNNEPPDGDRSALAQWQLATYNAIRGTGNNTIILLETAGNPDEINVGLPQSVYAQMSNTGWDLHDYGWTAQYSTDQGTVDAALSRMVRSAQLITSSGGVIMPVIIGEYGDSTTGMAIDPNGNQNVRAVHTSQDIAGAAAWVHARGNPGDGLLNAGGGLSAYGQAVAAFIGAGSSGASICKAVAAAASSQVGSVPVADAPEQVTPLSLQQAQDLVAQAQRELEGVGQ